MSHLPVVSSLTVRDRIFKRYTSCVCVCLYGSSHAEILHAPVACKQGLQLSFRVVLLYNARVASVFFVLG